MAVILKKIALAVATDRRVLKFIGGVVLGVLVLVFMPIAVMLSVFSGDISFDNAAFQQAMQAQLTSEQQEKFDDMEEMLSLIETQMTAEGHGERVRRAQWLYLSAFTGQAEQDGFVEKLVGCFDDEQSDEELLLAVQSAFGVTVDLAEFRRLVEVGGVTSVESTQYS